MCGPVMDPWGWVACWSWGGLFVVAFFVLLASGLSHWASNK